MRNFNIDPLDLSDYNNGNLYEGEKVYRVTFGSIDEAYAVREEGEDMEDFMAEVEWEVRRHKGSRVHVRNVEDVTGTFED